jgi:hypothetical protein
MSWDFGATQSIEVPTTTNVDVDRVVIRTIHIDFENKQIAVQMDRGVADGANLIKKDEVQYVTPDEATFNTIMGAATQDGEGLEVAIERVLFGQANSDEAIPNGSVS